MIYILRRECGIICIPYGQIYTYEYKNAMQLRSIKKPSIVGDEVQFHQSNWMCPDGSNPSSGCLRKWEGCSFRNGHQCGACHNVSDAQVRTKKYNIRWERILKWQQLILFGCLCLCFVPFVGSVGGFIYVVLGSNRCDWHLWR